MANDSLFCPLRKTWVAALPEEKVRQAVIQEMIHHLGYPPHLLIAEKSLDQLPHLQALPSLPKRRADLLVFAKNLHPQYPFYPLLLIECKAIALTDKVLRQLIGYNQFVKAYFIAVTNYTKTFLGTYHPDCQDFLFQEGLLPYPVLLENASRLIN